MATSSRRGPHAEVKPWGTQDSLLRRVFAQGERLLRGIQAPPPPPQGPAMAPLAAAPPGPVPVVPSAPAFSRGTWSDRLWGEGMTIPGGAEEVLRLAALLPLAPADTLLMAGLGARSAGSVVAGARGCFVAAHDLATPSPPGHRPLPRRVTAATLSPEAPAFRPAFHQHALLLEPLRHGGSPGRLLHATAAALRDKGEVVLLELVAREPVTDARWLALEARRPPPAEAIMAKAFDDAGFRVHVVEDAGARHQRAVLLAWAALLEAMRLQAVRPAPRAATALVTEAEAWLLRLRLLRGGRLRLLRWHATMARRPA